MKKCWLIVLLFAMLTGCAAAPTFESLGAIPQQPPTQAMPAQVMLQLPEDAAADVFGSEGETLYICDGYSLAMQTLPAGDLKATVRTVCGFDPERLTLMESASGKASRFDFVWTASAEQGDMLGRAAVIDDGAFHYCLYVMAEAAEAGALAEAWNTLFASFCLEPV